ncbi:MAG TPA: hypothetical protein VLB84_05590, partial [Bacteroidia bacterium]|nr:hypothetical protein [Bacteroidia bacterium]
MHPLRFITFAIIILIIDLYFYQAVSTILKTASETKRNLVFYIYAGFSLLSVLTVLAPLVIPFQDWPKFFKVYFLAFIAIILFSKI